MRAVDWHRLFGLVLTDFFTGSPFVVELEKNLSLKGRAYLETLDRVPLPVHEPDAGAPTPTHRHCLGKNSKRAASPRPKGAGRQPSAICPAPVWLIRLCSIFNG